MNDTLQTPEIASEQQSPVSVTLPPRKVYAGMWGVPEVIVASIGALAVLGAVLLYLFLVTPTSRDLEHNRSESDRLQAELTSAQKKYGGITNTETQVTTLLNSVSDFETDHLPVASVGKNALYQRINSLIAGYGLVNTTGPDYISLDAIDQSQNVQTDEERGRAKFRSLFPGVYVTMTLDGSYQNLRRFISDIEHGNEFIVISSVELSPSDNESQAKQSDLQQAAVVRQQPVSPVYPTTIGPNGRPVTVQTFPGINPNVRSYPAQPSQPQPVVPKGKSHGETVSLRLELAAYFRRPNSQPVEAPAKGGAQ